MSQPLKSNCVRCSAKFDVPSRHPFCETCYKQWRDKPSLQNQGIGLVQNQIPRTPCTTPQATNSYGQCLSQQQLDYIVNMVTKGVLDALPIVLPPIINSINSKPVEPTVPKGIPQVLQTLPPDWEPTTVPAAEVSNSNSSGKFLEDKFKVILLNSVLHNTMQGLQSTPVQSNPVVTYDSDDQDNLGYVDDDQDQDDEDDYSVPIFKNFQYSSTPLHGTWMQEQDNGENGMNDQDQ